MVAGTVVNRELFITPSTSTVHYLKKSNVRNIICDDEDQPVPVRYC